MNATELKERLRSDLKAAMQARAADEVRLLRTLIAALDNAEAVPLEARTGDDPSLLGTRAFGDPSGEVARREIDGVTLDALLQTEIEARLTAAADYERHRQEAEAARLRAEAGLIARYR